LKVVRRKEGFPEKARAIHTLALAAVFPVLVFGGFLFVFGCIFLSLVIVYRLVVASSQVFSWFSGYSLFISSHYNSLRAVLFRLRALLFALCALYLYWPFDQV
jgi:hypothetical protein